LRRTRLADPAFEVQVRYHQAGGSQRSERGLPNLNALAAARRAGELGAENAGDVLLQVREIGDELEAEEVVAVFGGRLRNGRLTGNNGARRSDGDGLAGTGDAGVPQRQDVVDRCKIVRR